MTDPHRHPLLWLPSLYFAKGMPYVMVTVLSLLLLRQLGMSLAEVTLLVSFFYLPWVLKPWWVPTLMRTLSARLWILLTELGLFFSFSVMAFVVSSVPLVFALLMVIAFLTAIHNVAVDGLFRQTVEAPVHSAYHHVRELSRKLAVAVSQGVIVMLVGNLQVLYRYNITYSWSLMFYLVAGLFLFFFLWHLYAVPAADRPVASSDASSPLTGSVVFFLLCYGLSPAFQTKVSILFLVEPLRWGGLGLSPQEFGLIVGSVGILALTIGGVLGAKAIRRWDLEDCLWPMSSTMLVPSLAYVWLSFVQPSSLWAIGVCVFVEQLCYGFGYAAYLCVLHRLGGGEQKKMLMALSFLLPCALSGLLVELTGYGVFFFIALALGILGLLSTHQIRKNPMPK